MNLLEKNELNEKTGTEEGPVEKGQKIKYKHPNHGKIVTGMVLGCPENNYDVVVVKKSASYTEEVNKHYIVDVLNEKYNFETGEWEAMA